MRPALRLLLAREGFNGVRRTPLLFSGSGFVYSPAIIAIAPSPFQSLQVNSLSMLIMPRNERRAWGGGAAVRGGARGLEGEKQGSEGEKHLSEKEK